MSTGGNVEHVGGIAASMEIDMQEFGIQMAVAEKLLEQVRQKMQQLDQAFQTGKLGPQQYARELDALRQEEQDLIGAVGQLNAELGNQAAATAQVSTAHNQLGRSASQMGGSASKAGYGLMLLGQAIDDVQYGIQNVVNNVPGMVAAFGGSAGLAGGIGIVTVGVAQLYLHWNEWTQALELSPTESETDRLLKLAGATREAADAAEKAAKAKQLQNQVEGMATSLSPEQRKTKGAVEDVLSGPTYERTLKGLIESRKAEGRFYQTTPEGMQVVEEQLAKDPTNEYWLMFRQRLREKQELAGVQQAREDLARAATDPEGLNRLMGTVARHPTAFPAGLGEKLQAATPEGIAAAKAAKGEGKAEDKTAAENQRLEDQDIAADQRESARRVEADRRKRQQAARQAADKQQRAFDQEVNERAKQLSEGELGTSALSQNAITEADVRQRLAGAGLTPAQVEKEAGPVFAGFARMMEDQIRGKAISGGFDADRARAELLAERIDKANDDPNKLRKAEDPGDLMRQLMRLRLDAQPEARGMEFVAPAEMAARVQMAANQPEDRSLRAMLDVAENTAEQVKILEKIQGGVPAVAT
jgi:hypothetical protein